jgi:hypothetical protein
MNRSNFSRRNYWAGVFLLGGAVLALAMLGTSPTRTKADEQQGLKEDSGPRVIDRDSVAYGRTYSELSAAWWQWAFSIPVANHPLFDNADCSTGQSGPVWFLGGKFCQTGSNCNGSATRSCSIPARKAVFFPILNVEDSAPEEPAFGCGNSLPPLLSGTIAEMRQCDESVMNGTYNLEADLDGKTIRNLKTDFRVQSIEFDVTWPDDNVLTAIGEGPFPAGTFSPVVDDGVYVMMQPLPAGSHTLHFQGTFSNGFTENITYHLNVSH